MCSRIASVPGGSVSSPAAAQRGASRNAHTASFSKIKVRFMIERRAPVDLRPPIHECKPSPHYAAKQFPNLVIPLFAFLFSIFHFPFFLCSLLLPIGGFPPFCYSRCACPFPRQLPNWALHNRPSSAASASRKPSPST